MRNDFAAILAGTMFLALPVPASAQGKDNACAPGTAALPSELAGWSVRRPLQAAKRASLLNATGLQIGQAVDATLVSTPDIQYVVRPEKPGGSVSYGGLFTFTVEQTGTYRVALGSGAWVDVLQRDKAIVSSAHGHGPECSGIRKMVDFPLTPGRYTLQVAANGEAALPLLVTRLSAAHPSLRAVAILRNRCLSPVPAECGRSRDRTSAAP